MFLIILVLNIDVKIMLLGSPLEELSKTNVIYLTNDMVAVAVNNN